MWAMMFASQMAPYDQGSGESSALHREKGAICDSHRLVFCCLTWRGVNNRSVAEVITFLQSFPLYGFTVDSTLTPGELEDLVWTLHQCTVFCVMSFQLGSSAIPRQMPDREMAHLRLIYQIPHWGLTACQYVVVVLPPHLTEMEKCWSALADYYTIPQTFYLFIMYFILLKLLYV